MVFFSRRLVVACSTARTSARGRIAALTVSGALYWSAVPTRTTATHFMAIAQVRVGARCTSESVTHLTLAMITLWYATLGVFQLHFTDAILVKTAFIIVIVVVIAAVPPSYAFSSIGIALLARVALNCISDGGAHARLAFFSTVTGIVVGTRMPIVVLGLDTLSSSTFISGTGIVRVTVAAMLARLLCAHRQCHEQ